MVHSEENPKWTRLPEKGAKCCICSKPIYPAEEYEVVKHKGSRPATYFHTECFKKERSQ